MDILTTMAAATAPAVQPPAVEPVQTVVTPAEIQGHDSLTLILSLVLTIFPLVAAILGIIIKYVQNDKVKKHAIQINEWTKLAEQYVKKAETLVGRNGLEKKLFVENSLKNITDAKKGKFNVEEVSEIIEGLIDVSKSINTTKTEAAKVVEKPLAPAIAPQPEVVKTPDAGEAHGIQEN